MKALSIAREQNGDGGWNFYRRGSASGIDDSAGAVEALAVAGGHARAVTRGAAFIARQRSADGGFPLAQGGPSNAQSTAKGSIRCYTQRSIQSLRSTSWPGA